MRSDAAHRPDSPVQSPPDRVRIELESGITWERLSHFSPAGLEFILVTYRPGSGQSGKYQQHEGFETAYIESGEARLHHKFDTWTLRAGGTNFDASEPHRLENLGTRYRSRLAELPPDRVPRGARASIAREQQRR